MSLFENNYEAPEWEQLSEEEKKLFLIEEEKSEKKLLRIPVYCEAVEICHIVESMIAAMPDDESALHISNFFLSSAFSIRFNIRGCSFTNDWYCHTRNAAIIREFAEALCIASAPDNNMACVPAEYLNLLHEEMKNFRREYILWVQGFDKLKSGSYKDDWGLFVRR